MYMNFTVPIPGKDSGVTTKVIKGTTYVYYERERKYDPVNLFYEPVISQNPLDYKERSDLETPAS